MKVGIISMQRVVNCGSYLQAYALKRIIESLGHEVVFIDYKVEKPICSNNEDFSVYRKNLLKNIILNILSDFPLLFPLLPEEVRYSVKDRHSYKSKYFQQLGLTKKKTYNTKVDTVVIGSDEVFNCLQLNPEVGFSPELFGKNSNAKRVITYAASFGNTTFEEIEKYGKRYELESYFTRMSALSVRDNNSAEIIKKLTGMNPSHNLDPVLIYGYSEEITDINIDEDYVLVYAYRRRIMPEEAAAIMGFAKEKGLKTISVGGYQPFCDENILASPFEVLGYFKKAKFVFTDTFHGTIFSVINHKQFVVFVREGHGKNYGNSEKMNGLLSDLGLESRKVTDLKHISELMESKIDYESVDLILESERKKSREYLIESI